MKKYLFVLILLILVIVFIYLGTEKEHVRVIDNTNYTIIIQYPNWTCFKLSGTDKTKYFTIHSQEKTIEYYQKLEDKLSNKGFVLEEIEDYRFYFDSNSSTYYFIPEVTYFEKRSMLVTQYHIESPFIDKIDLDNFRK